MTVSQQLNELVTGLESGRLRNDEQKTLEHLERTLAREFRDKPYEIENILDSVERQLIQKLIKSTNNNDKRIANRIIGILLSLDTSNVGNRNVKLMEHCQYLLLNSHDWEILDSSSSLLIKTLSVMGGNQQTKCITDVYEKSVEWISAENVDKKFSGLTTIRYLADRFHMFFYSRATEFIDEVLKVIRHGNSQLREAAAVSLNIAIHVTGRRELEIAGSLEDPVYAADGKRNSIPDKNIHDFATKPDAHDSDRIERSANQGTELYEKCINFLKESYEISDKRITRSKLLHGNLLVLRQLLMISNASFEARCEELGYEESNNSYRGSIFAMTRTIVKQFLPMKKYKYLNNFAEEMAKRNGKATVQSMICKKSLLDNINSICEQLLGNKKNLSTRGTGVLLDVIPRLAALNPRSFQPYAQKLIEFLLRNASVDKFRNTAFRAIGLLVEYTKLEFREHLPKVTDLLKENIRRSSERKGSADASVYLCIRLLAKAYQSEMPDSLLRSLETMISEHLLTCPLSASMLACIYDLMLIMQHKTSEIRDGLWKVLQPIIFIEHQPAGELTHRGLRTGEVETVVLALQTLSRFPFDFHSLIQFLRKSWPNFLFHIDPVIRTEAIITCGNILQLPIRQLNAFETRQESIPLDLKYWSETVRVVLTNVIQAGVADQSQDVRLIALRTLCQSYLLPYLAQQDSLRLIFLTVHDSDVEIRQTALQLLGLLADINAAQVLPTFGKLLIELLSELKYGGRAEDREKAALLLGLLASSAPRLMRQFVDPLLKAVVSRMSVLQSNRSKSIAVAIENGILIEHLLFTIGELVQVAGPTRLIDESPVLKCIVDMLQTTVTEQHTSRIIVALRCLSNILLCTGLRPYLSNPEFPSLLLELLTPTAAPNLQTEVVRVLGLIGALDPLKFRQRGSTLGSQLVAATSILCCTEPKPSEDPLQQLDLQAADMLVTMNPSSPDEFYSIVALAALMRMFPDRIVPHENLCLTTVKNLLRGLGLQSANYMHLVVPKLIKVLYDISLTTNQSVDQIRAIEQETIHGKSNKSFFKDNSSNSSASVATNSSAMSLTSLTLNALGEVINMMGLQAKSYQRQIYDLLDHLWSLPNPQHDLLIHIVKALAKSLGSEFRNQVCRMMPHIARLLHSASVEVKVLFDALQEIAYALKDLLHLLLPPLTAVLNNSNTTLILMTLKTLETFFNELDMTDYASLIMHALLKCMETSSFESKAEVVQQCASIICRLAHQLGKRFMAYMPTVDRVFNNLHIVHEEYRRLRVIMLNSPESVWTVVYQKSRNIPTSNRVNEPQAAAPVPNSITIDEEKFRKVLEAWKAFPTDHLTWMKSLAAELCSINSNGPLETCTRMASLNYEFARDIFNVSFVSFWMSLSRTHKNNLREEIEGTLRKGSLPEKEVALLNLIEFMEHCDSSFIGISQSTPKEDILSFDCSKVVGKLAMQQSAFAKALHYREQEFLEKREESSGEKIDYITICDDLIVINQHLQSRDAAIGVLKWATNNWSTKEIPATWYHQVQLWEEALKVYEEKTSSLKDDETVKNQLQCLQALGEWDRLDELINEKLLKGFPNKGNRSQLSAARRSLPGQPSATESDTEHDCIALARMGVLAACSVTTDSKNWKRVEMYIKYLPETSFDYRFYQAVLHVHHDDFEVAQKNINMARERIVPQVTSQVKESYSSVYRTIVSLQLLAQLEQVIQYKLIEERQQTIVNIWNDRLYNCEPNVDDWQRMLLIRQLVRQPKDDHEIWVKFSSLCYKMGLKKRARRILVNLLDADSQDSDISIMLAKGPHEVKYAFLKYVWRSQTSRSDLHRTFKELFQLTKAVAASCAGTDTDAGSTNKNNGNVEGLLAKCYLKLGAWYEQVSQDLVNENGLEAAIYYLLKAQKIRPEWYKTWHAWANINYQAVLYMRKHSDSSTSEVESRSASGSDQTEPIIPRLSFSYPSGLENLPHTRSSTFVSSISSSTSLEVYCKQAVEGFLKSICLCTRSSLQDTLRLLSLWFDYGHLPSVNEALNKGVKTINRIHWLQVVPQLIARIDAPNSQVRRLVRDVLTDTGKYHPQALVFPLTVASQSRNEARRRAARHVIDGLREHNSDNSLLIQQALLVSNELIRVAILWHEEWYEVLQQAGQMYFVEQRIMDMIKYVEKLHVKLKAGAETFKEQSFLQAYLTDLTAAYEYCNTYRKLMSDGGSQTGNANMKYITQAWDLYYQVFKRISKQLAQLTYLDLKYVSPKLHSCRNLDLAVPGTYDPSQTLVSIDHVAATIQVISSKQRPRKLSIFGSNGQEYCFLLKGHEDLRQDERVMQLFGLINKLLEFDRQTRRVYLKITRYCVIPLSTNSGLIGWVPHCDTLNTLIKEYRDKRHVPAAHESRLLNQFVPDYERITILQKVEAFEHVVHQTPANDLAHIFWLKSSSSEVWFTKRVNYTRSLAVMSMVGYILGLGDRHPSNLMLQRITGQIVHIDFGDCFEAAIHREKFPEKIPFRLTRMLINAMEVTGIEGTFRITCEHVLNILRNNREDVSAVLEAFIYDPLFQGQIFETCLRTDLNRIQSPVDVDVEEVDTQRDMQVMSKSMIRANALDPAAVNGLIPFDNSALLPSEAVSELATSAYGSVGLGTDVRKAAMQKPALADPQLEESNKRALKTVRRVRDKLTGCDFGSPDQPVDVTTQASALIKQATSHENLCQCYSGWCPLW